MPLAPETIAEIERIRAALPRTRSALLPALKAAQKERGWLPRDTMAEVAARLGLDPNAAYMLATFYTMLHTEPVGQFHLEVCRSLPCYLRGSDAVIDTLRQKLGVADGDVTPDGLFSMTVGECLGDCPHAPMMRVNDDFVGPLEPDTLDELLALLRARAGQRARGLIADPAAGPAPSEGPLRFSNAIGALPLAKVEE